MPTDNAKRIDIALQGGGAHGAFLGHLHDIGWRASDHWLEAHFDDLGERTTWRPSIVLEESLKPAHLAEDFERSHPE